MWTYEQLQARQGSRHGRYSFWYVNPADNGYLAEGWVEMRQEKELIVFLKMLRFRIVLFNKLAVPRADIQYDINVPFLDSSWAVARG